MTSATLLVEDVAGAVLIQDLGRSLVSLGVPIGGAFDRGAHVRANTLVGNDPDAATLEVVGTLTLRAHGPMLVCVTGTARVQLEAPAAPPARSALSAEMALDLPSGSRLEVSGPGRSYLAVRGGLRVRTVLGSRSSCLMGPLGPPPIRAGHRIPVGAPSPQSVDARAGDYARIERPTGTVPVVAGPHGDLRSATVEVLEASRIGIRLAVRAQRGVTGAATTGLPSHGVLPGAIQALPNGDWMLLGPDAGTMGGYPVIAVLAGDGLDRWAHVSPGQLLNLVAVPVGTPTETTAAQIVRVGELG